MNTQPNFSKGPYQVEPLQSDHGASIAICSTGNDARILATIDCENPGEDTDADNAIRAPEDEDNARLFAASWSLYQVAAWISRCAKKREIGITWYAIKDEKMAELRAALALVNAPPEADSCASTTATVPL